MQQPPSADPSEYISHSEYILTLSRRRSQIVKELHHVDALLRMHGADEPEPELPAYEEEDALEESELAFPNAVEILSVLRALPEEMAASAERDGSGNIRFKGILLEALKVVAHFSGGYVRFQPAKALIRQSGISSAMDRNLHRSLMEHLKKDNGYFRTIQDKELFEWKQYFLAPQLDAGPADSLCGSSDDAVPVEEEPTHSSIGSIEGE